MKICIRLQGPEALEPLKSLWETQNFKCIELEMCISGRPPGGSDVYSSLERAEPEQVLTTDLNNSRKFIVAFVLMKEDFSGKYGAVG